MRKVVLYIAMSLDGYIADVGGGVSWLQGDGSDSGNPGSYPEFIETVDTVILGYKTYRQIVDELFPEGWVYAGKTSYVLTHHPQKSTEEIIFTSREISGLMEELQAQNGKDIWICGGAAVANQLLERDLIDRFCFTIIPTVLGGGVRLFSEQVRTRKLKLISTRHYDGMVDLCYERRKQ